MNFNFKDVKENIKKTSFPIQINQNIFISSSEYNEEYDCLDITFENENHVYRERIFNPLKNVPSWTTPEKELYKTQSRIKHILRRYATEEQISFDATSWREMCEKTSEILMEHSQNVLAEVKFIFDKNFLYPKLGLPRFIRTNKFEQEAPLEYSKWEKENALLPEIASNEPVSTTESEGELF